MRLRKRSAAVQKEAGSAVRVRLAVGSPVLLRALICLGLWASTRPLAAQDGQLLSGEVTCERCRIAFDTVVTIGGLDGPGLHVVARPSKVAVDRLGRIIVTVTPIPEISVFDSKGRFLRTVGRSGEGPGEYRAISHVNAGPGYIHVFAHSQGRVLLDYDFNVVRMDRFPGQVNSSFVTESDDVIFSADVPTQRAVGHKFHILSPSGEMTSFGGEGSVYRGRSSTFYKLTGDGANTVWAVRGGANIATRWTLTPEPRVEREFARQLEAFDDGRSDPPMFPSSWNMGLMLDGDGLWIVWRAPDLEWGERVPAGSPMTEAPPRLEYDGWLDLVDPDTGLTIARHRNDGHLLGFAQGSRYIVAYHETDEGVPYLHLLEPRLSGS